MTTPVPQIQKKLSLEGKLFARSQELKRIRSCLVSKQSGVKIVLVSGSSGVGKSRLLHAAVTSRCNADTTFVLGRAKFDSQIGPLEAIQDCINDIVRKMQMDNDLQLCRKRLHETMEREHQEILLSVIPETRALLADNTEEKQEEKKEENWTTTNATSSKEDMLQLQLALKSFLHIISEGQQVVLLLDDLQWCGQDSFDILLSTLTDPKASNIVLCGSYRDSEITTELKAFIDEISRALASEALHYIQLTGFDLESVNDTLASLLYVDSKEETRELAKLVHQRTDGNILFMRQFLEELQHEGLLKYNIVTTKWEYDVNRVQDETVVCENILQIVTQKLHRLEPPVQALLKLFACFGSRSNTSTLEICRSAFPEIKDLQGLLRVACSCENLLDDLGTGWYKFSHDKVLESARSMLPTGRKRERLHWDIGMLLFRALDDARVDGDRQRFICADQINVGALHFVNTDKERVEIARLNLHAAKSASRLSAFRPACRYCQAGIEVLGEHRAYSSEIALELYVHYAEMLFCVGEMAQATVYCDKVFASASLDRKVPCYLTMLQILLSEAKNQEVVDLGLRALKELGEEVPRKPNKVQALRAYKKTTKLLNNSTPEGILNLPLMKDSHKAACIRIMLPMVLPLVHLAMSNLHTVIVGRMLHLTFQHGLTTAAPEAFAIAGVDAIAQRDDLKNGYQLGKLAALLADRLNATIVKAKVYFWTTVFTQWWLEPLSQCLESCLKGYTAGMALGDQHYAFHCVTCYALSYVYSGIPLLPLLDDLENYCQQMVDYGQSMVLLCVIPMWQFALNLCGRSDSPLDMTRGYAIEKQELVGNENRIGEQACWSFLMQLCYYMDDIEKANDLSQRMQGLEIGLTRAEVFYPTRVFFFSLIAVAQFRRTRKRKFKQEAKTHLSLIMKWIKLGAINLVHKGMILQAEMDGLTAKDPGAVRSKYEKASAFSTRSGFLQDAALASQLAASFCEKNSPDYMEQYVVKAWEQWMAYDAIAVAQHLERKYPDILDTKSCPGTGRGGRGFRSRPRFTDTVAKQHQQLDFHD